LEVTAEHYLVLTEDFPLADYLATVGKDMLDFNHPRPVGFV
jgi:hypothetical protein